MDILLFCGQSNMQGQTEKSPDAAVIKGAYEYRWLEDKLVPLQHPVGENIGDILLAAHEGKGSPVPAFCKAYTEETQNRVVAVHIAKGTTAIAEWLPEHVSGRYHIAVQKAQAAMNAVRNTQAAMNAVRNAQVAMNAVRELGKIYFIWLQGESDALAGTSQTTYEERMRYFRKNLIKDLNIDGFCIIRVGKFANDERDIAIIRAQETLCKESGFIMLTRLTGYLTQRAEYMNPDAPGHYNNAGSELLGESAGKNLARIRMGVPVVPEEEFYGDVEE